MKINKVRSAWLVMLGFMAVSSSIASAANENGPLQIVAGSPVSTAQQGKPYQYALKAQGGKPTYRWTLQKGALPQGLTLDASSGMISGVPKTSGISTMTAMVQDQSSPSQAKTYALGIAVAPALTIQATTPYKGEQGTVYFTQFHAQGGSSTYVWSIKSGTLPTGVTLISSTGVIQGIVTSSGSYNLLMQVADAKNPELTATQAFTLTILPAVSVSTTSLPASHTGVAYSAPLQVANGRAPYIWGVYSGSLPAGLTLSSTTGILSGTPTTAGTSTFTVFVHDTELSQGMKTFTMSVTAPLAIKPSTLPASQQGTAYAASVAATGGTPAYTWSVPAGKLPAGITLAASTGVLSGTPTVTGTSAFTLAVTDNSVPAQTATSSYSLPTSAGVPVSGPKTWYIRPDGGTRYSANASKGQCDGLGDAAYGGVGVNQHCAFNDYRFLWDDQNTYGSTKWVISGGDTVILRKNLVGGEDIGWRVGFDTGDGTPQPWCVGGNGGQSCSNPVIPAGTAAQHTRILGENYAGCSTKAAQTQIHGGYGLGVAMNLSGAQYVDVQCIEITDHSNCVVHGSPALPKDCQRYTSPIDDFDSDGIGTNVQTHDLLLKDMWIHGHTDRGIIGPIGGVVTADNVDIDKNGEAGWDFDDGNQTASVNATLYLKNSVIEWSGCNEEYPIVSTVPVTSCYSQSTGGYGDGIGTPPGFGMSVYIDHSIFRFNTQDGEDFGHINVGLNTLNITNSESYGNLGQQFKWGPAFTTVLFTNNFAEANCARMQSPFPGAPSTYNAHVADFCRASDALSFNFVQNSQALFAHNTIVTYAPTTFDMQCVDPVSCSNAVFTLTDNIVRGYTGTFYDYGGKGGPAGYCGANCNDSTLPIGTINRSNNIYYGLRVCPAGAAVGATNSNISNESCVDAQFTNEPVIFTGEASLDNFNFALSAESPARQAGVALTGQTKDYTGAFWLTPPSLGAVEFNPGVSVVAVPY